MRGDSEGSLYRNDPYFSVTKERTEVVIEATTSLSPEESGAVWREYEFKCKPGNLTASPCLISPYHYRLDWLMWFAAFQNYQQNPWLLHLMGKMLENDPVVDSLVAYNPFKGKPPPRFIRAKHYKVKRNIRLFGFVLHFEKYLQYIFTRVGSKAAKKGRWWSRKVLGEYVPPVNLEMLRPVYQQFGWKTQTS